MRHPSILIVLLILVGCNNSRKQSPLNENSEENIAVPVRDSGWTQHSVSYEPIPSGICSGSSTIYLFKYPQNNSKEEKINKIVIKVFNYMMFNEPGYLISVGDFYKRRQFKGDSANYGFNITTSLIYDKNYLSSFKFEMLSNCGSSVSDHPRFGYLTIDIIDTSLVDFKKLFNLKKKSKLQATVKNYARQNKIDNILYTQEYDTIPHDQRKLKYLNGMTEEFFITDSTFGLFTLVFDNNQIDWQRRAKQEGVVGEEYMMVEIPKRVISEFINTKYKNRIE